MSRSAFLPILFVFLLPLAACDAPSGQGENKSPADSAANSPISRSQTPAPEPEGASTDFLLKKYQAGVDFYAIGSEPDWNLEMDFEGDFRFNTIAETGEMYTPSVEPVLAQDANIKRYRIEVEAGEMIIQVAETPCNNTMSGEAFPYRVTVDIKRGTDTDYTTFEGCGRYVPDFRLTDIWVLEELYGEKVSAEDFTKELPRLEIKVGERRFMGHDGCNSMNGSLEAGAGIWRLGPTMGTLMACPEMENPDKVRQSLEASTYEIENLRLTLKKGPLVTSVWRKVD